MINIESLFFDWDSGVDGEESALECWLGRIVSGDFRETVELLSDPLKESESGVLLREQSLDVVWVLSDDEVGEGQIAEDKLLLSNKLLEVFEFWEVFRDGFGLHSFVVLVEEESSHCSSDLVENWKEAFEFGVVGVVLSQELSLPPSLDDVALNGLRFSEVVLSVDEIG